MHKSMMDTNNFDEMAWRAVCDQCADIAIKGSGLSETMFARNLFGLIKKELSHISDKHHAQALMIARDVGYLDAEELEANDEWNSTHGYCQHGIELGCCPAGCE